MYSDQKSILHLTALLHAHGVRHLVLCPGSRNAPLTHSLSHSALFACHGVTDERSAGFQAIGLALASGRPAAVCVTSGSALTNLHPAVAEAYYQRVPLIVISADRPAAWIGQTDGQTMPQPQIFGPLVRCAVSLPQGESPEEIWHANRLINEALLAAFHRGGGPVHINVPLGEPLYRFHTPDLPPVRVIRRLEGLNQPSRLYMEEALAACCRPMLLLGQSLPQEELHAPIEALRRAGFAVLGENLANLPPDTLPPADPEALITALPEGAEEDYRPDLLVSLGGHLVSKCLKHYLRQHPPHQHWHVSPEGEVADLFQCLTHCIEAPTPDFLHTLLACLPPSLPTDYAQRWNALRPHPTGHEGVVPRFLRLLPPDSVLHLANSSAVRLAQGHPLPPGTTVCCNRGLNGIEGCLSTAVGYARATPGRPNFVLIGDLAFLYDQNALWPCPLPQNLRILLLNSGGGRIFESLPLPLEPASRTLIQGTHQTSSRHLARHYGLRHLAGEEQLEAFIQSNKPTLLEIL